MGEISGRIKSINEIVDLPFEAIEMFYRKDDDEAEIIEARAL